MGGRKEKCGRGYKRDGKVGPVNYVGDRNTCRGEMPSLSFFRVNTVGGSMEISLTGGSLMEKREKRT